MTDDLTSLAGLWDAAWAMLERGATDRTAPARFLGLASVGQDGGAEARLVVLRDLSRAARTLTMYTDSASAKVAELRADPRATLLAWDPAQALQVRLRVNVNARPGASSDWNALPDPMRAAYGGTPPPGTPIAAPEDWQARPDPARFTILTADLRQMEILHLGVDQHRRANFIPEDDWSGRWIAP